LVDQNIIEGIDLIEGIEMNSHNQFLRDDKPKIKRFRLWKLNLIKCKVIIILKLPLMRWFHNNNIICDKEMLNLATHWALSRP